MRKTLIVVTLILVLAAAASVCSGKEISKSGGLVSTGMISSYDNSETALSALKKSYIEIGPEVFYHRYEEPDIEDEGEFAGIVINVYDRDWATGYSGRAYSSEKWMFGLESEFAYGRVDYDGELMDGTPYNISDIDDFLVDLRFLFGPDFPQGDRLNTIYIGFGYRFLRDDSTDDPAGYLRKSNYLYLPVGLKTESFVANGWSLGGSAEFDLLLFGRQVSTLYDTDFDNDQRTGYGFRAAVSLKNTGNNSSFSIEPFIKYWHIDESELDNEAGIFVEPENETLQSGVQLIWTF